MDTNTVNVVLMVIMGFMGIALGGCGAMLSEATFRQYSPKEFAAEKEYPASRRLCLQLPILHVDDG